MLHSLPKPSLKPLTTKITKAFFSTTPTPTLLLKQCKSLLQVKLLHQHILVCGGVSHSLTHLIAAYLSFNAPSHALSLLERLATPRPAAVYWWNVLIRSAVRSGFLEHVLSLYSRMQRLGWKPDHYTYPFVFKACGELGSLRRGEASHGAVCVGGFESNVFVCNAMVAMYGRCGGLGDARKVFDEMLERGVEDIVSWNSIMAVYAQSGDSGNAVEVFGLMVGGFGVNPDAVSLVNVLPLCSSLGEVKWGMQIHGYGVKSGLVEDVFVGNSVIDMYAKCGMMDEANNVFDRMRIKDVVSWNAMVTGYSQIGRFENAIGLFEKMREEKIELNVVTWSAVIAGYAQRGHGYQAVDVFREMMACGSEPNVVTLVSLLSGCASAGALNHGRETHGYAIKWMLELEGNDPGNDMMIINGLIDMYTKCKSVKLARTIFDSLSPDTKSVVTWTVMIGGYAQHGEANEALELFYQMLRQDFNLKPNGFTICCALMSCARLGALRSGKEIHAYILRNQYDSMKLYVANCLIDMYSKSGDVDAARVVFDNLEHRNEVSWTSLMTGYGMHGRGEEALQIFDEMQRLGLVPDAVTYLVVLYACSHSGMIDEGMRYFNGMSKNSGVVPGPEHYACMADLLGRAGRLDDAMNLIKSMPMEPTTIVWVALLSACRIHGNIELGEYAADRLAALDSENDGSYTLLSNIYANAKRWKDVSRIRLLMKHAGIQKRPGCSWVQGKKGTTTFFVGDRTHPQSEKIYQILVDLIQRIKGMGYVPETSFALHDVDDEEKGDLLSEHSEKLALAYAILTTPPGTPIRITKNLRVCGDCHTAMKYISMIIEHEIILRDSSRFHHFKKGSCSCRGYW
ncbi:hypothetical protein ACLB2K_045833 [Fragaria x ananassa]